MSQRDYDAILLDLDGTLLGESGSIHPATRTALAAARDAGVVVMIATGRSKTSTLPVIEELGFPVPAVIFNGAAVWCPEEGRLVEERILSNRTRDRSLAYGEDTGDLTVVMLADRKLAVHPRSAVEERSLQGLHGLELVSREELRQEFTMRVTFLGDRHPDSAAYGAEVEARIGLPVYMTHFPLSVLPEHRQSAYHAVDVHPPCEGKGEALRYLAETRGISAERVVAVGDATNDLPMIERAGLGVAMEGSMIELLAVADRVIGSNDGDAIARLVVELLL